LAIPPPQVLARGEHVLLQVVLLLPAAAGGNANKPLAVRDAHAVAGP
jgi:hypothetical protein